MNIDTYKIEIVDAVRSFGLTEFIDIEILVDGKTYEGLLELKE